MKSRSPKGMLPRGQMEVLRIMARRTDGLFPLAPELVEVIGRVEPEEGSEINQALRYAANATQEDVSALLQMLDENPELLLEAGNVVTPGGLDCRRVTIYEFCLGAGDPKLAIEVQKRFAKLSDPARGKAERERQYALYAPHIKNMLEEQQAYDFAPLLKALKEATKEDVAAMRKHDMKHPSALRDAILQFRQDHAPTKLLQPQMHHNYASLKQAYKLLNEEWESLLEVGDEPEDKHNLFAVLIIGFLQRRLPGFDRCFFAQNQSLIAGSTPCPRALGFTEKEGNLFDPTPVDDAYEDLGFKYFISGARRCESVGKAGFGLRLWRSTIEKFLVDKKIELTTLAVLSSQVEAAAAPPSPAEHECIFL